MTWCCGCRATDARARCLAGETARPACVLAAGRWPGRWSAFAALLLALLAAPARATSQQLALHPVAGATATAVGVLFPKGFDDDPDGRSGLAAALASARLAQARGACGPLLASGALVGGDFALVFAVLAPDRSGEGAAFLGGACGDGSGLADDALQLVVARAALAADDAEHLYPGDVLLTRARQRLFGGTPRSRPPAGRAQECMTLTPAQVRAALAVDVGARAAALGAVDEAWADALGAALRGVGPCPPRPPAAPQAGPASRPATVDVSARTDAPYVAAAFAAPGAAERPAFALGLEVARARAFARWRLRGQELFARAPFVRWSWLRAEPVAVVCRRGEDGVRLLPGQRPEASGEDEEAAVRAEVEALLAAMASTPPSAAELSAAREALRGQLGLPAPGAAAPWAAEPATLPGKLQALLLGAFHEVDVEALERVSAARVGEVMAAALGEGRSSYHVLAPRQRAGIGFRSR